MSKAMKIWFVIAAVLMALGVILLVGALAAGDWDITKLSTVKYETNTYEAVGDFNNISINTDMSKVILVPSDDGKCRVVCYEQQNMKHSVTVQNGTLKIDVADTRKWYEHIGIMLGSPHMTVYLPKTELASLCIETHTGNISLHKELKFESLDISGTTANVECRASVSGSAKIRLSTGSIRVSGVSMGDIDLSVTTGGVRLDPAECGNVSISVTTGRAGLTGVSCKNLVSKGTTGRIVLRNVIAAGRFDIERSTGSVTFEKCDAGEIYVKTDTGSVKGTLLTEKVFIAESDTGSVSVPKTVTGGRCEISTDTGNIKIDIQN